MDVDVEAMLEAPYQEKMDTHRDLERDHKDYREEHRYSDRHYRSSRSHSRHSHSRHSRSPSRHRSHSRHSYSRHSRSPSRHRSSRSRSRHYYRSRSRDRHSRDYRSRSRDRHSRDYRARRSPSAPRFRRKSPSPPIPEADRDRRTVFVTQLAARLKTRELEEFFSQAGKVREATIIMDKHSRKSKGVGYVEFYEEQSVQNALSLSGTKLLGIPVLVSLSEAEKNRLAMQASGLGEPLYHRLYVGSIHFSLTEDDVRQIFEPFGPLDFIQLHKDPETGRSKGFGFVQFKNAADAKEALEKMNGFELAGRNLKVGLVTDKSVGGYGGGGFSLDDEETEGVTMNSLSRAELMAKLAAREPLEETQEQIKPTAPPKPFIPVTVSRYIMLNNMFNPAEESDPDWVSDLETDVKLECERYGHVEHIKVNSESMGEVFLKFDSTLSAEKAVKELDGRWFGGKKITASYVSEAIFNANAY